MNVMLWRTLAPTFLRFLFTMEYSCLSLDVGIFGQNHATMMSGMDFDLNRDDVNRFAA